MTTKDKKSDGFAGSLCLLLISLSLCELCLRIAGYNNQLHRYPTPALESDPELGWIPKPGNYQLYNPELRSDKFSWTILPDRSRSVSGAENNCSEKRGCRGAVFLGGSFMQGFGLSDKEHFPALFQQEFPDQDVKNHAVRAYGTYHNLLRLRRLFKESHKDYSQYTFFYGFAAFHEDRNILLSAYVRGLAGGPKIPSVRYRDGAIVEMPPQQYGFFPGLHQIRLIRLLDDVLWLLRDRWLRADATTISEALLLEMRDLVSSRGAGFVVIVFDGTEAEQEHYMGFFAREGIPAVNLVTEIQRDQSMRLKNDPHPNAEMVRVWYERFSHWYKSLATFPSDNVTSD